MEIASRQAGVITRRQALAIGITDRMIFARSQSGRWQRPAPGVYCVYPTPHDRLALAVAVAKLTATVSHESAGAMHEFERLPVGRCVVTVPHRLTNRCDDVTVHESTDLTPDHVMMMDDLPVTTPERTLVDLAAVLRPKHLRAVVEAALVRRQVEIADIWACFESVARRGKPGVTAMRAVLTELCETPVMVESELERRLLSVLRSSGLPDPVMQPGLPWRATSTGRVDFAYPQAKLIIECDGRRWHTSVESFELDRRRDNLAQLAGWRVLRFTWVDVTSMAPYVVETVRSALRAQPAA
jgi:predicted transcriptional regulator of viral defense system